MSFQPELWPGECIFTSLEALQKPIFIQSFLHFAPEHFFDHTWCFWEWVRGVKYFDVKNRVKLIESYAFCCCQGPVFRFWGALQYLINEQKHNEYCSFFSLPSKFFLRPCHDCNLREPFFLLLYEWFTALPAFHEPKLILEKKKVQVW